MRAQRDRKVAKPFLLIGRSQYAPQGRQLHGDCGRTVQSLCFLQAFSGDAGWGGGVGLELPPQEEFGQPYIRHERLQLT